MLSRSESGWNLPSRNWRYMLDLVHPLWQWASTHVSTFQAAQAAYDEKQTTA